MCAAMAPVGAKLWRYSRLARVWSWSLIVSAAILLVVAVLIRAGSDDGIDLRWMGVVVAVTGVTGALGYPLLKLWLRRSAMPSLRLPQASKSTGPRLLHAARADWRRWGVVTTLVLTVGGTAMMTFLIGMLGAGGTAEGVVVGLLAAWGFATLDDARAIDRAEQAEGRRYYAAVRRPAAVGDHLVWLPAEADQAG